MKYRNKNKERRKILFKPLFREGKSKKIARYLGSDLTEAELENLRKRAEVLIRDQIEFYKKQKIH